MALADTARLVASLELDDRKFKSGAASAERSLSSLERKTSTIGRVGAEAGRGLGVAAHNLRNIALVGAGVVTTQVVAGIRSLTELEEAMAQTEARIDSTGGAANVTADEVRGLSESLETLTTIDDKAIQRGQNMLLTFTNIRNEVGEGNDIFDQATTAILDLSVAMGTDPQQAALQLGKALNDPVRGLTALRRVGIQFTEDQEKQIQKMVEAGDTMGAQKVILAELNKEFGGSAEAFAKGPGATMRRFSDAVETGQQALARGLLPVIERFSKMAQDAFADPQVMAGIEEFGKGLGEGLEQLIDIASNLPWSAIGDSLKIAGTGARAVLTAFTSLPPWVQTAVLTGWGLNKLTGGALGNIAGMLTKGAFGALRGSTPATPVFTKEVGLGGAAGGPLGAGGRFGGALKLLGGLTAVGFAALIADTLEEPMEQFAKDLNREVLGGLDILPGSVNELQWPFGPKNPPGPRWLQDILGTPGPGSSTPLGQFNAANQGGTTRPVPVELSGEVDDIPRVRDEIRALRDDNRSYDAADSQRFASLEQRLIKDKSFAQELTPERFIALLKRTSEFGEKGVGTSIEVGKTTGKDPTGKAFLALARRLPEEHLKDRKVIGELQRHITAAEELQRKAIKEGDVETARKLQRTIDGIHGLLGSQDRTRAEIQRLQSEERTTRQQDAATAARTAQHLSQIESVGRDTAAAARGTTATLERKNFSPTVNVGVDVYSQISVSDVVRASIHTRTASGFRGGNSEF